MKRQSGSPRASILIWLAKLAAYYDRQISDEDYEIYIRGLSPISDERLAVAFERCLKECEFMPKLAEICRRLPDETVLYGPKPISKECDECRGTGWKVVDRPDGLGKWATLCSCRRQHHEQRREAGTTQKVHAGLPEQTGTAAD